MDGNKTESGVVVYLIYYMYNSNINNNDFELNKFATMMRISKYK